MAKRRVDGWRFLIVGFLVFASLGLILELRSPISMVDFKLPFYSAKCLLRHGDPYNGADVKRMYVEGGESTLIQMSNGSTDATRLVYFPTIFSVTIPLALLTSQYAQIIWSLLIFGGLTFASLLMWNVAGNYAPTVSGVLIGFMLANSEVLTMIGNPDGVAISLCIVSVWCFVKERHVMASVTCLAIALVIKPHEVAFVWLYFMLSGGIYRKRALQTLALFTVMAVPAILWVTYVAPHWLSELRSTLAWISAPGGFNDPGPSSLGGHRLGMIVDLQAAISVFRDDPRIYNPLSYGVCGLLLLCWSAATIRARRSPANVWIALAAVSALTVLPLYHRQPDTKLMLLAVPACAMLCVEGGPLRVAALLVTGTAFLLNGDLSWIVIFGILDHLRLPNTDFVRQLVIAVQLIPAPLSLLGVAAFYSLVYMHRVFKEGKVKNS